MAKYSSYVFSTNVFNSNSSKVEGTVIILSNGNNPHRCDITWNCANRGNRRGRGSKLFLNEIKSNQFMYQNEDRLISIIIFQLSLVLLRGGGEKYHLRTVCSRVVY